MKAEKRTPERYYSTQTTFPEHMLLETRIGDYASIQH